MLSIERQFGSSVVTRYSPSMLLTYYVVQFFRFLVTSCALVGAAILLTTSFHGKLLWQPGYWLLLGRVLSWLGYTTAVIAIGHSIDRSIAGYYYGWRITTATTMTCFWIWAGLCTTQRRWKWTFFTLAGLASMSIGIHAIGLYQAYYTMRYFLFSVYLSEASALIQVLLSIWIVILLFTDDNTHKNPEGRPEATCWLHLFGASTQVIGGMLPLLTRIAVRLAQTNTS